MVARMGMGGAIILCFAVLLKGLIVATRSLDLRDGSAPCAITLVWLVAFRCGCVGCV